jgi:hypothetical protein
MTYIEAALTVLQRATRPLATHEIFAAVIDAGLIVPTGKTPRATMSAALYQRAKSDKRLVKLATPGRGRAKRGSVRWTLRDSGRASR